MLATIEKAVQSSRIDNNTRWAINQGGLPLPSSHVAEYDDGMSLRNYLQSDLYRQKQRLLDEKIKKLIDYGYDQEAKRKTGPIETGFRTWDYSHVDDEFKTVTITSEAFRKGNYISRRVCEIAGTPLEIYLYALDNRTLPNESQRVVRDLYIAKDQEVTAVKCDDNDPIPSKLDIRDNLKKRIIGWVHSHGALDPFFSHGRTNGEMTDEEGMVEILKTCSLTKHIRVLDPMIRGEGYKGVEYDVRYTSAIVFNALNAKPFVAVAVEYTRRYDGKKVFHINEHCRLRVIEENNGIDMDPASIDRQILERVYYNGRRLGEIRGMHDKTEPIKMNVRTPLTEVVKPLEGIYAQLEQRFALRNRRLRALCRGLKSRYNILRTEQEQSREALNALTTRIEKLEALTNHSYVKRLVSKLRKKRTNLIKQKRGIESQVT